MKWTLYKEVKTSGTPVPMLGKEAEYRIYKLEYGSPLSTKRTRLQISVRIATGHISGNQKIRKLMQEYPQAWTVVVAAIGQDLRNG